MNLPNLDRLAQEDPAQLTSRQIQVRVIREDYEAQHPISPSPEKTARMAAAVPALLAHIDELYGQIESLRKYAETTKYHQDKHAAAVRELEPLKERVADALTMLDRFDGLPADDLHVEALVNGLRNTLGGAS